MAVGGGLRDVAVWVCRSTISEFGSVKPFVLKDLANMQVWRFRRGGLGVAVGGGFGGVAVEVRRDTTSESHGGLGHYFLGSGASFWGSGRVLAHKCVLGGVLGGSWAIS